MLKSHIDAIENQLLATSRIPANSGHPLHKGTPREAFIKQFLANHLSERADIGTGEIIDADSKPREPRNQIDIVIYRRDYPKLDFGGGISAFLAESVIATIEIKSVLDKGALSQSIQTAKNVKKLKKSVITSFTAGHQPPGILSYVVAYDGPVNMQTVYNWIPEIHKWNGIVYPQMGPTLESRITIPSPTIDAIFILGKGFAYFDNAPLGFLGDELRKDHPEIKWIFADSSGGNLLLLFIFLTQAVSGISGSWWNPSPYLSNFIVNNLKFGD